MRMNQAALRRTRLMAAAAAGLAFLLGAAGLVGWMVDSTLLKTGFTGQVSMKANTAVALCAASSAMLLLQARRRPAIATYFARVAALLACLIGAVTASEHLFGWDAGVDELLFVEPRGEPATTQPGRMGPPAAICLAVLGLAGLLLDRPRARGTAQWLALATLPLPTLGIIGYLAGAAQLYGVARYTGVALHTAVALVLVALSVFLARPEREPAAILVADNAGGAVARTMLPAAILLPIIVGWLRTIGQARGVYDTQFGRALLLLTLITLFTVIVWRVARRLSSVAIARATAEEASSRARAEAEQLALERVQLLENERALRLQAEHAARLKDQFLATLSHELRTPLNAILGWASIARESSNKHPELERPLEIIERNARVQAQLIEDLLDVSRIVSGKMQLNLQRVELPSVIQAAVSSLAPAAEAKQVRIELEIGNDVVAVTADPARLQQVIWNLLSNAIKFSPSGAQVRLGVQHREQGVELSVSDQGVGISPEFLPHVFDRFRQADSSTTRRHGGLGLGLAIVKQLTELHGGRVEASSPGEQQGATFRVWLPLGPPPDDAKASGGVQRADAVPLLAEVRVLVVDDEADAREFVGRALSEYEATVLLAGSADEALELLDRESARVLISDIGMPGKDGYQLIHAVRERWSARSLPAIAVTAFARPEDRKRALEAGFQLHLSKPIAARALAAAIATLLEQA